MTAEVRHPQAQTISCRVLQGPDRCSGCFYVNLIQARVVREEEESVKKMPP